MIRSTDEMYPKAQTGSFYRVTKNLQRIQNPSLVVVYQFHMIGGGGNLSTRVSQRFCNILVTWGTIWQL